ncbi:unnamed protein product [Brassica rapa]|uniref:Protein kinase domain-containing protein n=1 Tax=Brassica campestris TaxID=3711 RepID=A0A3P5Y5X9_BRACM|nr:unnamed protein product [Brassica rapa]VDC59104.1 unnamed protein product [Brassica rapa]
MTSHRRNLSNHFIFHLLLLLLPTLLQALNTDGVLLLSFKYTITSDPLSVLRNWNYDDETPCSWTGVTCTELGSPNTPDMSRVTTLALPNKQLLGSVSPSLFSIPNLRILDLSNNFFHGSLPDTLSNATQLRVLSLGNNNVSGQVPESISNVATLQLLNLSANAFTGKIPQDLSLLNNLTVLDISSNHLDGSLPQDLQGTSLHYLNLSHNQISGDISPTFAQKVPPTIILDISFNNLTGPIPSTPPMLNQRAESFLGNLGLCGQPLKTPCSIPSTLSDPQNISDTTSPAIAVMPRSSSPPKNPSPDSPPNQSKLKPTTIVGITVADIAGLAIIAMIILYVYQLRKRRSYQEYSTFKVLKDCLEKNDTLSLKKEPKQSVFALEVTKSPAAKPRWSSCVTGRYDETSSESSDVENQKTVDALKRSGETQLVTVDGETKLELETLLKASAYVLGTSRGGIVYKAVLENGAAFAVRRIGAESCTAVKLKEFEREVQGIAKLRHPNLVRVRGFVWGREEKLLISDYVPNGSLHCSSIYSKSGSSSTSSPNPLSFKARVKIARGIARGIAYIHDKKHVHGNIKPNNILFDSEFEPIITDTGLDRLMTPAHSLIAGPASGSHHHPPEWSTSEKPNPRWDVYSFGVIFLELLMGRVFLVDRDFVRESEVDEKTWFLRLVDGTINSDLAYHEDEVVACFRLTYGCVSSLPQKRPSMKEVVQVLEKISV